MPLDFRKITTGQQIGTLISPRDIFAAMPAKAPGFGYLRDVQGQVLDAWERRRNESDLAMKMNTGTGKTIVGLLLLQSCINERSGPALYVAPNTYLVKQVQGQADKLGIATVDDPESIKYLAARAIAVVNIHKLVNGRSVFGGPGSSRPTPLPIGSVVIDDAHAALATTEEQSTILLPSNHKAYQRIFEKFHGDLQSQSETTLLDIEANVPSAVLRVPFWAWADRSQDVAKILHEYREEEPLIFSWPLVADVLSISQAVFTGWGLEIRPPMPPVERISSFAQARRRIYLTATLADDSVLVTNFNADPDSVGRPITPATAADLGDRMILAPQEINPLIDDEQIHQALRRFADEFNVVVLVPSHRKALQWGSVADVTAAADAIAGVVEKLQRGHLGLVVLINKYDGIDLPDDACRILVVDGLPEAYGGIDRREAVALGDSDAMRARQLQRIEQGMGRGIRSADDYCVVVLLGSRLSQLVAQPANANKFGPATRAQLELSRQVATQLEGKDMNELASAIRQALDRDPEWVATSRSVLAGVTYSAGWINPIAIHTRAAFNAASARQFDAAVHEMSSAVNGADDPRIKGWLQEQLAVYKHHLDPAQAQQVLAGAVRRNPRVTRPLQGVTYHRLAAAANQGQAASGFLTATYSDRNSLLVGFNTLLEGLLMDPDRTDEFEDSIEALAKHLGFKSDRPERDTGNGPDVLWAVGGLQYLVIECKSGATTGRISRRDVAQLAHSLSWFDENYDQTSSRTGVLMHPGNELDSNASAPPGARVMTETKLESLRDAVRAFAVALGDDLRWKDQDSVTSQLHQQRLAARDFLNTFTDRPRSPR